jgi:hypothetical protein
MYCLRMVLLVWHGLFLIAAEGAVQAPPPRTSPGPKNRTAEEIARLIALLGSPTFAERERASQALEKIGIPALPALHLAAQQPDLEVRRRAGDLAGRIENSLEALVIAYQEYGLPMPPAGAPLVLYHKTDEPSESGLAFLLSPAKKQTPPVLQEGLGTFKPHYPVTILPLDPSRLTPKEAEGLPGRARLSPGDAFILAVQCQARGWTHLAPALLGVANENSDGRTPQKRLLHAAWNHWWSALGRPGTDWRLLGTRLRALRARDGELDTEENRKLLVALEAALVPSKARPGSVEAMIDDLIQVRNPLRDEDEEAQASLPADRLVERGFAAVPDLIDHLGDIRLTRCLWVPGCATGTVPPPHYERVGEIVARILGRISAGQVHTGTRAQAEQWWKQAREVGEEAYWMRHALPRDTQAGRIELIHLIGKKYPHRLPALYRIVLEQRSDLDSSPVAEAIGKSSLPRETKRELLAPVTRHKESRHRRAALEALAELAPDLFAERLIESLEELPGESQDFSAWGPEEALFASLVTRTEDPRVWKALGKTARRSEVRLRLEYLNAVALETMEGPRRKQGLAFLAGFLDDATVRDAGHPLQFDPPFAAASEFRQIEVRNFAALSIARIFQFDDKPKRVWGEVEWAGLRRKVREALRQDP